MPIFPIHPRLVHFPIALCLVGVGFLILAICGPSSRRVHWMDYGQLSLRLAWVGGLLAILSGLVDQSKVASPQAVAVVLDRHITAGLTLIVAIGLALYWPIRNRRLLAQPRSRLAYLALLFLVLVLLLLCAWFGCKLVYQLGVGVAA